MAPKTKLNQSRSAVVAAALLAFTVVAAACGDDVSVENQIDTDGVVLETDGVIETSGSPTTGADGTAGDPTSAVCYNQSDGTEDGTKWMCGGVGLLVVDVKRFPGWPVSSHTLFGQAQPLQFGHNNPLAVDSYDDPLVMACCDGFEAGSELFGQPPYVACHADAVNLVCNSAFAYLTQLAQNRKEAGWEDTAEDLFAFAEGFDEEACGDLFAPKLLAALDAASDLADDISVTGELDLDAPQYSGKVEYVTLGVTTELFDVWQPALAVDVEACDSSQENDSNTWNGGTDGPSDYNMAATDAVRATLIGPVYADGAMAGRTSFSPDDTALKASFDPSTTTWGVNNLSYRAGSAVVVANSGLSVSIDDFKLATISSVDGLTGTSTSLVVPAGVLQFTATGTVAGEPYRVFGTNATTFELTKSGGDWRSDTMGFQHLDSQLDTWNVTVAGHGWN